MSLDVAKNFAYALVAVAPSPAASGTTLTVSTGYGVLFPATPFNATVWTSGAGPLSTNAEIVRVTSVVGDVFTIQRTQEGTSARTILAGDQIAQTITAKLISDLNSEIDAIYSEFTAVDGLISALSAAVSSVASGLATHIADVANPHNVTKAQVGLSNVDNTSDADKPISTATAGALADKASNAALTAHVSDTANPHSVTKAQVGLSNVDNTSDADKPVSTATAAAIATVSGGLATHVADTANPHSVTKAQVGLSNVDNTSDLLKPISTAVQAALDLKQALSDLLTDISQLEPVAVVENLTYSSDGDANGLFYRIGSLSGSWSNPSGATNGVVFTPGAALTAGTVATLTDRATSSYQTNTADTYIGVDIGAGRTLALNRISIRHSSGSLFLDALRDWKIQGSNDVLSNTTGGFNGATWTDLDVNVGNAAITAYNQWYTKVPSAGVATPFRFFRLLMTGVGSNGNWRLNLGELEFYGTLSYTTAASIGHLYFDGSAITSAPSPGSFTTLTTSGRAGIGTGVPSLVQLHVSNGTLSSPPTWQSSDRMIIESATGTANLQFFTEATAAAGLRFSRPGARSVASLVYDHSVEALVIESSLGKGMRALGGAFTTDLGNMGPRLDLGSSILCTISAQLVSPFAGGGSIGFGLHYDGTDARWEHVQGSGSGYGGYLSFDQSSTGFFRFQGSTDSAANGAAATVTDWAWISKTGINNTAIGVTTPAPGAFTTLSSTSTASFPGLKGEKLTAGSGYLTCFDEGANSYNVLASRNNDNSAYLATVYRGLSHQFAGSGSAWATLDSTGLAITGILTTTGAVSFGSNATIGAGGIAGFNIVLKDYTLGTNRYWGLRDDSGIDRLRFSRGSSDYAFWDVLKTPAADSVSDQIWESVTSHNWKLNGTYRAVLTSAGFASTADESNALTDKALGYRNVPQNSQSADYTTVAADAGKHIYHPSADTTARNWTIASNASVAYPIGTGITFVNDTSAGIITIAVNTDTLVLAGAGSTGSRSLGAGGVATAIKVTATRWIISGTNLT